MKRRRRPRERLVLCTSALAWALAVQVAGCHKLYVETPVIPSPKPAVGRIVLVGDAGIKIGETALVLKPVLRPAVHAAEPQAGTGKLGGFLGSAAASAQTAHRQLAVLRQVPILAALLDDLTAHPDTAIAWLGDNVYARGIPAGYTVAKYWDADGNPRPSAERDVDFRSFVALHAQVFASAHGRDATFVPGNHDWDSRIGVSEEGPLRVKAQHDAISELAERVIVPEGVPPPDPRRIRMLPAPGCAGPQPRDLNFGPRAVRIIALDTEALLQAHRRRPVTGCPAPPEVYASLADLLARAPDLALVVAHHPLLTFGPHNGYAPWWRPDQRFAMALRRGHDQDLSGCHNKMMVEGITAALAPHRAKLLAYASGHEHALQVLRTEPGGIWHLGSGSASKRSRVRRGPGPGIRTHHNGYMVIELRADGEAVLQVVDVEEAVEGRAELQIRPPGAPSGPSRGTLAPTFSLPEAGCDAR